MPPKPGKKTVKTPTKAQKKKQPKPAPMIGIQERMPKSVNRRAKFRVSMAPNGSSVTVKGTDYVAAVNATMNGPLARGQILASEFLSPSAILNTRLELYSKMYEKYYIEEICYHFVSALPTTTPGSYIHFIDRDSADPTAQTADSLIKLGFSVDSSTNAHLFESSTMCYRPTDLQKFYYCRLATGDAASGANIRLESPGRYYLVSLSNTSTTFSSGTTLGDLWVDYVIRFFDPTIENPVDTAVATVVSASVQTPIVIGGVQGFAGFANAIQATGDFNTVASIPTGRADSPPSAAAVSVTPDTTISIVDTLLSVVGLSAAVPPPAAGWENLFAKPITGSPNLDAALPFIDVLLAGGGSNDGRTTPSYNEVQGQANGANLTSPQNLITRWDKLSFEDNLPGWYQTAAAALGIPANLLPLGTAVLGWWIAPNFVNTAGHPTSWLNRNFALTRTM